MSYVQGFVVAVPTANKDAYVKMATDAWPYFKELGAMEMMEAWGADVSDGKVTDFKRAVQAKDDEAVVFSWIIWPDRNTADIAGKRMMEEDFMKDLGEMPFDGMRMIIGGFEPVVEVGR